MAAPLSCDSCEEMLANYLLHAAVLCLGMEWWTWHVQREAVLVHQRWQEV